MGKPLLVVIRLLKPIFRRWPKVELAAAITTVGLVDLREKWDGLRIALRDKDDSLDWVPVAEKRLKACQQCALFDRALHTCGSAIKDYGLPPAERRGCYCHVPTFIFKSHSCWLYTHYEGQTIAGWPAELNSHPL